MKSSDYWNFFLETGMPEYYVLYQQALKMEARDVFDDSSHRPQSHGLQ